MLPASVTTNKQIMLHGARRHANGDVYAVEIRWDDSCRNGRNSFGITCDGYTRRLIQGEPTIQFEGRTYWMSSGGCQHDIVAALFPEIKHLIRWHMMMADGPMHYYANTIYYLECGDVIAAMESACWGEGDMEIPSADKLGPGWRDVATQALLERLPRVMLEFKRDIEALGLVY